MITKNTAKRCLSSSMLMALMSSNGGLINLMPHIPREKPNMLSYEESCEGSNLHSFRKAETEHEEFGQGGTCGCKRSDAEGCMDTGFP
jgi:hypothetical protein